MSIRNILGPALGGLFKVQEKTLYNKPSNISYIKIDTKMEFTGETQRLAKSGKPGEHQLFLSPKSLDFLSNNSWQSGININKLANKLGDKIFANFEFSEYGFFKDKIPLISIEAPLKETIEVLIPIIAEKFKIYTNDLKPEEPKFLYHHIDFSKPDAGFKAAMFISDSLSVRCSGNHLLILSVNNSSSIAPSEVRNIWEDMHGRAIVITNDKRTSDLLSYSPQQIIKVE